MSKAKKTYSDLEKLIREIREEQKGLEKGKIETLFKGIEKSLSHTPVMRRLLDMDDAIIMKIGRDFGKAMIKSLDKFTEKADEPAEKKAAGEDEKETEKADGGHSSGGFNGSYGYVQ